MFAKFFLNWDIFGYMPSFLINKNKNFKTLFGSLISTFVVALIIYSIWQFGREIIYKLTPDVTNYNIYYEDGPNLQLSNENFVFGFSIFSENENPQINNIYNTLYVNNIINDESIMNVKVKYMRMNENNYINFNNSFSYNNSSIYYNSVNSYKYSIETLQMLDCNKIYNITEENKSLRKYIHIGKCLDLNQNILLRNDKDNIKNFVSLEIKKCSNDSNLEIRNENNNITIKEKKNPNSNTSFINTTNSISSKNICKSNEEINKILSGLKILFFIRNPLINPSDYDNPVVYNLYEFREHLSPQISKEVEITLSNIEIQSDVGWLMEDIQTKYSFEISNKESLINTSSNSYDSYNNNDAFNSGNILRLVLNLSENSHVIKRLYIKVQTIVANLGGIIKFLILCGEIFVYFFSKIEFKEFLVKIFFDDNSYKKDDTHRNILSSSNNIMSSQLFNSKSNQIFLKKKSLKPSMNEISNINNTNIIKKPAVKSLSVDDRKASFMRRSSTFKNDVKNTKLNTWEILKHIFCLRFDSVKNRYNYINSFYELLSKNFDLIFTIKSQIEFEFFKSILLNKEQNDILTVTYKKRNEKKTNDILFESEFEILKIPPNLKEEIKLSYKKLCESKDIISRRILENFEMNSKNFFKFDV